MSDGTPRVAPPSRRERTTSAATPSLREVALLFLRLGATAFGGPAAHIAMMQRELVEERAWVDRQRFLDLVGAVNLIPGPNSTELAIAIGHELHGRRGLVAAGLAFIAPAFIIVLTLAVLYRRYGALPDVTPMLLGIRAVVLAIILQAVWRLVHSFGRRWFPLVAAAAALAGALAGIHELALLLACGLAGALIARERSRPASGPTSGPASGGAGRSLLFGAGMLGSFLPATPSTGSLLAYFLYAGSVLYGSGYVLVALLRRDLVETLGWLSERQLFDAIAIGQVTPGPVFTTATFVGYLLDGTPGAIVATIGIFLPSFLFVLLLHRFVMRMRSNVVAAGFLDGVSAAAVGAIAAALVVLGRDTLGEPWLVALAVITAVVLATTRINPTWLIAAGALAGWLLR